MKPVLLLLSVLSAVFLGACAGGRDKSQRAREEHKYGSANEQGAEVAPTPKPTPAPEWFDRQVDPTGRPNRPSSGR